YHAVLIAIHHDAGDGQAPGGVDDFREVRFFDRSVRIEYRRDDVIERRRTAHRAQVGPDIAAGPVDSVAPQAAQVHAAEDALAPRGVALGDHLAFELLYFRRRRNLWVGPQPGQLADDG